MSMLFMARIGDTEAPDPIAARNTMRDMPRDQPLEHAVQRDLVDGRELCFQLVVRNGVLCLHQCCQDAQAELGDALAGFAQPCRGLLDAAFCRHAGMLAANPTYMQLGCIRPSWMGRPR